MATEHLPFGQSQADKGHEAWAGWFGMPSDLTPELASKFMLGLHGVKTIMDMTNNGEHYICSRDRFKKHCKLNKEWGETAGKLSFQNSSRKESINNWKVGKAFEFCMSGRHRMEGDNVTIGKAHKRSNRFCRACRDEKATRPMTADEISAVKHAVSVERRTIRNITTGVPVGAVPAITARSLFTLAGWLPSSSAIPNLLRSSNSTSRKTRAGLDLSNTLVSVLLQCVSKTTITTRSAI